MLRCNLQSLTCPILSIWEAFLQGQRSTRKPGLRPRMTVFSSAKVLPLNIIVPQVSLILGYIELFVYATGHGFCTHLTFLRISAIEA